MLIRARHTPGFTIVELLIVIVVIAILAVISIVSYNGITQRSRQSGAASSAEQATKKMLAYAATNSDQYPVDLATAGVSNDTNTVYEYTYDNTAKTYCITATFQKTSYYISNTNPKPVAGLCPGHTGGAPIADGSIIQTINSTNCPSTRTRAVDARDTRTYWVQKLADGKCWMMTNLAYLGGGTNTYGDVMTTLSDGTGGNAWDYAIPRYYTPPNANPKQEPTTPSTSTDGGTTNPQYGYLYNWCAAMGGQATAACANGSTPAVDTTISICPSGWHLPSGNGGEFTALNTALNSGSTTTDAGLRTNWLAMRGGGWLSGFNGTGAGGVYWTSTVLSAQQSYRFEFDSTDVYLGFYSNKYYGFAVRCIAN